MKSAFDYQTNCLSQPERQLVFGFLQIVLDPLAPGMPLAAFDLAWLTAGYAAEKREEVFRGAFGLYNLQIAGIDFVATTETAWFRAWADSIALGDSDPFADCPCNSF